MERPAESLAGGMSAVIFLGDLLGFLNNATGGLDHLLPCLGIGRDLLCDVAGDLALSLPKIPSAAGIIAIRCVRV